MKYIIMMIIMYIIYNKIYYTKKKADIVHSKRAHDVGHYNERFTRRKYAPGRVPGSSEHGVQKDTLINNKISNAGRKTAPGRAFAATHHRCRGHQHNRNSGAGGRGRC